MQSAIPISVLKDFKGVREFFSSKGLLPDSPSSELLAGTKGIHRATYSLILWRFRLKGLKECGKVFVEELASDALQILPQALMGYRKAAKLLNRGVIENTLRHIYFADHPVEFERMHRDKRWYVSVAELKEYTLAHPLFSETEPRFDAVNRLSRLYSELSEGVHGSRVNDLELRIALKKIAWEENAFKNQVKLVQQSAESANFLLAVFHREQFSKFQLEDRRIILRSMPKQARQALTEID
jgi:hypothetical protein